MPQRAGALTKRIQIFRRTLATDATTKQPKETFALLATVWADRTAETASEIYATSAVRAVTIDRWGIRKRTDITPLDQVRYGGKVYQITGIEDRDRDMMGLVTKLYV